MPGSSSRMPYAPQGVKGFAADDGDDHDHDHDDYNVKCCSFFLLKCVYISTLFPSKLLHLSHLCKGFKIISQYKPRSCTLNH